MSETVQQEESEQQTPGLESSIQPRNDQVLVKRVEGLKVTPGGIHIPIKVTDQQVKTQVQALVVAVGPGRPLPEGGFSPLDLTPGDYVILGKASGRDLDTENFPAYCLVRDHEVLAKVDRSAFEAAKAKVEADRKQQEREEAKIFTSASGDGEEEGPRIIRPNGRDLDSLSAHDISIRS